MFESSSTEFKREYTDDIKKSVVAFANTSGGKIYIGIEASETAILKMIKETDGDKYENSRSLNQNLSFSEAKKEFAIYDVPFSDSTIRTLKLVNEDNVYTNLGLLLSDQCPHTIKAAVFEGDEKMTFKDRAEFSGSLLKQINDAFEFINKYNKTRSEFEGIHRIDIRDYPVEALREALLNSVVHREYAFSSSILISIFDSRIEIVSIGGLARGINKDEIYMGLSVPRNENLANVFYRLQLIEAFGTGIPKIFKLYEKYSSKPVIQITENAFKITLPSSSFVPVNKPEPEIPVIEKQFEINTDEDVLRLIQYKKSVVRSDIEEAAGISQASASRILRRLLESGKIIKTGKGKRIRYSMP